MKFSKSIVEHFNQSVWPALKVSTSLRYGQAFHQVMRLDKVTSEKHWCDLLYYADNDAAKKMVEGATDYDN